MTYDLDGRSDPAAEDAAIAPSGREDGSVAADALAGLMAARKTLPPRLFYDEEGCRLFYEITRLPEYYLTRTEFSLLERIAPEVAALLPPGTTLVEYGASDEAKAAMLLRQTAVPEGRVFTGYVPIDIAGPALLAMRARLASREPDLTVSPVTADFMRPIGLPPREKDSGVMGFFPGSTIGNLEPEAAVGFLRRARETLGQDARFLLGFDICRDRDRLLPAYDDALGVTARFNRNLLTRLNREAAATFDVEAFSHRAVWNETESRIEMHLVSPRAVTVLVAGHPVSFARNETIHTENSYKYPLARMAEMVREAGWTYVRGWTDPAELFAIWLMA